jgi:hypothetical protein
VVVLDPNSGAVSAVFDGTLFYDLRYSRALNDVGTLAMTLPSTDVIRTIFVLDSFIEVYRSDVNGVLQIEETYLTRLTHRFIEGNEERFVVGGMSLNHLLMRRIVDPDDDPLGIGGYSTKSGRADQVMYDYCNEQIGPLASVGRRLTNLTITATGGIGASVSQRLRHNNLFKVAQDLAQNGHCDFAISRISGNQVQLDIGVIGTDRTKGTNSPLGLPWVGLSPLRGNLTSPSLSSDRKQEGNFIYALGQGQGADRALLKQAGSGATDSPMNRMEFTSDLRNVQKGDVLGMQTGANVALQGQIARKEFTYQPSNQEPGNKYHVDWDLGDGVTAEWDESLFDLRITNVEVSLSSEGETIQTTVTDDFVFPGIEQAVEILLPTRATLWHENSAVLVGNALLVGSDSNQMHTTAPFQNPAANGDTFTQSAFLRAGSYTLYVRGVTANNIGKIDWYIDNVLVLAGQDWYSAGLTYNVLKSTPLTIVGDGYHVLKGVVNGKNASSSNFFMSLTKMVIKQAND